MNVRDILLTVLNATKDEGVRGRTAIQKIMYFISVILKIDMGFFPHYYGPYSREVASTLDILEDFDFIDDCVKSTSNNRLLHLFTINEDGMKLFEAIKRNNNEQVIKIEEIVRNCEPFGQNYDILSWAAKIYLILNERNTPISEEDVISLAKGHDWNLNMDEINSAKKVLLSLGLIEITDSPP